MSTPRTSQSHPLEIAEVTAAAGLIGITFCPGKQDLHAASGAWQRDLATDLKAIRSWGASLILTLVDPHELKILKVPDLGQQVQQHGIQWRHLPIQDYSPPDQRFEQQWLDTGAEVRQRLRQGERVLIHCKGGLGRAGMMAARLLVEMGEDPKSAIRRVRRERKGAIETPSQLTLVRSTLPIQELPEPAMTSPASEPT